MREHGELRRTIDRLTDIRAEGVANEQLADACRELSGNERRDSNEEPVIYPYADDGLPQKVSSELTQFIDTSHIPDRRSAHHHTCL